MSIPTNGTTPFSIADSSVICTDIAICRTRYTIIWSSLVTILACVWSAVHRNIAGPAIPGQSRSRRVLGRVLETIKIVVVALLVPEWVLAWAVRQFLNARGLAKELEGTRYSARWGWNERGWVEEELDDEGAPRERVDMDIVCSEAGKDTPSVRPRAEQQAFNRSSLFTDKHAGRLGDKWTNRHGFFIIMGGYHLYNNGKPRHPLPRTDVVKLVSTGDLVPPTEDEVRGWSQGDALSKTLAVIQTLWFVVQCIARHTEGLPITQLEIMTLAYTTITVAMYAFWWDKPQNVGGPIRVAVLELPAQSRAGTVPWYTRIFYGIVGAQDDLLDMRKEPCVPTFYSGGGVPGDDNEIWADVIALAVAMVFGAVHCAAWNYQFPSRAEELIWRISSVAIVAIPGVMLSLLIALLPAVMDYSDVLQYGIVVPVFFLTGPIYVAARVLLLTLSFATLRSLPFDAYRAVEWTLLIPHFT
ncbi:hypothetical protein BV25DRAFT_1915883 [Artomyces pyxidatus]|uniref:Uncharacterized protein n=1 Tax=Artomyces pyxidatus TaxID=48021 RepID=A0ACB8T3F6_9AGAM|nr:hypothetical protein BV25DRAFT_1915883 [Artomyces pyxidatus]